MHDLVNFSTVKVLLLQLLYFLINRYPWSTTVYRALSTATLRVLSPVSYGSVSRSNLWSASIKVLLD